jgi:uncharacterized coiled-coil DUF342 family protein
MDKLKQLTKEYVELSKEYSDYLNQFTQSCFTREEMRKECKKFQEMREKLDKINKERKTLLNKDLI